jgi:hypothetical protein
MYRVNTETNPVDKNSAGCLSKGSGRLLILDRAAPHTMDADRLEYQKELITSGREYLYTSIGAFPL